MPLLQQKTIENIAKKRNWTIDKRSKNYTFIRPPRLNAAYYGAVLLQKPQLIWKDARLKYQLNVHLNAYFSWPRTKKECIEMLLQIEQLLIDYC